MSPTSGKKSGAKFDFFKFGYPLALLAKLVNGRKPERFCEQNLQSVYTLALLAKLV